MDISTFVFLGIIAAVAIYAVMIYNNLVILKHGVSKAWANIDVLLKQRHDELPKLVETCKQFLLSRNSGCAGNRRYNKRRSDFVATDLQNQFLQ
ncbi:MAG: hypothetical protein ABW090_11820 [Sedimenticola sp.]